MNSYSSYEEWLEYQPGHLQPLIELASTLVEKAAPDLLRGSKWGNATWQKGKLPLIFIHAKPDHLQLGFFAGVMLDDPHKVLQGKAKFVRHIPLYGADFDQHTTSDIIKCAVKIEPYR